MIENAKAGKQNGNGLLPNVLGMQKEEALRRLQLAGAVVTVLEVKSRKGVVHADETRIVRQRFPSENPLYVELTVSDFQTVPREPVEQEQDGGEGSMHE